MSMATPQVQLVAFDDPYSLPPASVERVRFHRSDATEAEDGLTEWNAQRQIVPGAVALASFDYQPVQTQHSGDDSRIDQGQNGKALQSSLHDYDPQSLYYAGDADQLSHYAQLRQQAHDLKAKQFSGGGSVRGLAAGQWFRLDDHPAHDGDSSEQREFVVTRQTLSARNNLPADLKAFQGGKEAQPFRADFDAQRRGVPLTPAYAHTELAKPKSRGVQTATVVGPRVKKSTPTSTAASRCNSTGSGRTNTPASAPIWTINPPAGCAWSCPAPAPAGATNSSRASARKSWSTSSKAISTAR